MDLVMYEYIEGVFHNIALSSKISVVVGDASILDKLHRFCQDCKLDTLFFDSWLDTDKCIHREVIFVRDADDVLTDKTLELLKANSDMLILTLQNPELLFNRTDTRFYKIKKSNSRVISELVEEDDL